MIVLATNEDLKKKRKELTGKRIGLVPTMGNLHEGHLSLVKQALGKGDCVFVTIFVNPKQFGPMEDFERYPRTLEQDLEKLKLIPGSENIIVWTPSSDSIYPSDFQTSIEVKRFRNILCDLHRPGHFDGVTTVVYLLFKKVSPHFAVFGQKDYQQYRMIYQMNQDLQLGIELHMGAIARESDGLALSSRNQYLDENERESALRLPNTLQKLAQVLKTKGLETTIKRIDEIKSQDDWEYLDLRSAESLSETESPNEDFVLIASIKCGKTRLLDNIIIKREEVTVV